MLDCKHRQVRNDAESRGNRRIHTARFVGWDGRCRRSVAKRLTRLPGWSVIGFLAGRSRRGALAQMPLPSPHAPPWSLTFRPSGPARYHEEVRLRGGRGARRGSRRNRSRSHPPPGERTRACVCVFLSCRSRCERAVNMASPTLPVFLCRLCEGIVAWGVLGRLFQDKAR